MSGLPGKPSATRAVLSGPMPAPPSLDRQSWRGILIAARFSFVKTMLGALIAATTKPASASASAVVVVTAEPAAAIVRDDHQRQLAPRDRTVLRALKGIGPVHRKVAERYALRRRRAGIPDGACQIWIGIEKLDAGRLCRRKPSASR